MKTSDILKHLRAERALLDVAITRLELYERAQLAIPNGVVAAGRRGRKFIEPAERVVISERMKRYWAERRKARMTA